MLLQTQTTPEEAMKAEALQKWRSHMEIIGIPCPINRQIGRPSDKQFDWAVNNWHYFIGSAHPEFCAEDIKLFCQSIQAKNFRFWIDNRSATTCNIRGTTDRRLETAITAKITDMKADIAATIKADIAATIKADIAATIKAERTISQLSPAELKRKVSRL